jgi:hypothetical protein
MVDKLKDKLIQFVNSPYNLEINLDLGFLYEEENQLASAISHYLRGAEYGLDNINTNKTKLIAECLLRAAVCMDKLGGRNHSTKSLILHTIAHMPTLPQAHLQMSKIYEMTGEWNECNAQCSLGLNFIGSYQELKYDGRSKDEVLNELLYQKAISNYYTGKTNKARLDLVELKRKPNLQNWIIAAIDRSLEAIRYPSLFNQLGYDSTLNSELKDIFKDSPLVSYSQCAQDLFVSTIINKPFGTYVELSGKDPIKNSNTNLLEEVYSWRGITINKDKGLIEKFNSTRTNKAIEADVTKINYKDLFYYHYLPKEIDYLQLDCNTPLETYEVLAKIPFEDYRFATITFKHDYYAKNGGFDARAESRRFLQDRGYELLISNVAHNCLQSYEDWWVHPELAEKYLDREKLDSIKNTDSDPKCIIDIIFKEVQ